MFNTDFIEIYDNAVPSHRCKEIINWMDSQQMIPGMSGAIRVLRPELKDDWEVDPEKCRFSVDNTITNILRPILLNYTRSYRQRYDEIDNIGNWGLYSDFNAQKYYPGQGYHTLHCEDDSPGTNRVLVWSVYLNTVTDKGGTYFSAFNKTVQAKEGRLIIFPPYWTHRHKGVVSKTQTKYIATGWFNYIE